MIKNDTEEEALRKLRDLLAKGEATIFTEEEVSALRNMIRVYRGLMALGWMGSSIRNIILIVMAIITAYAALTGALAEWIKKLAGGN